MPNSKAVQATLTNASVEERTITAVVTSGSVDRDYERVDVKSLRIPLKGGGYVLAGDLTGDEVISIPFLIDHDFTVTGQIGSGRKAYMQNDELVVEFGVSKRPIAQDLMTLVDEGHMDNSISITMSDYEYDNGMIIGAEILETSLVFKGSNKDARIMAVKSILKKESAMADAKEQSFDEMKAELDALKKQVEESKTSEAKAEEVVIDKPNENVETVVVESPVKEEAPVAETETEEKAEEEAPVAETEATEDKAKSIKETKKMSADEIATKSIVPKSETPEQEVSNAPVSKDAMRKLFVEQFLAARSKDATRLGELNSKAMEMRGIKSKAISYANGAALYQDEIVSNDILEAYTQYGNVGTLVNRVDVMGATKWKRPVETDGNGFTPVGLGGTKDEDKPVWTSITVTPHEHALIVAWYDAIARQTPIAVYNQIIRYIAKQYGKLEDKIVLTFAGGTNDGETYESTGLVPALETADRVVEVGDYTSAAIAAGLGEAYGLVESDGTATIVANRKTWGKMAVAVDTQGRTVFNVVGNQVQAGALGLFNVVVSQVMPADKAVVGVFGDYDLVTRGQLEQLFSREASVGSFNLFTQDGSAVRSNIDISGGAARLESFAELNFGAPTV